MNLAISIFYSSTFSVLSRRLKFIILWFGINFVPCVTRFDFETSPLTHDNQVAGALNRLEVLAGLIALVHVGQICWIG